jgi:O-antigen ligase
MKTTTTFYLYIIFINVILTILKISINDYEKFTGNNLSYSIFILILATLLILFFFKKYDYFIVFWISFYFACPIIKVPFTSIGSLGILNAIFIPLIFIKTFNIKNKYFLIIFSLILLSFFNLAEVSLRQIFSSLFKFIAPLLFFYFTKNCCKDPKFILKSSIFIALIYFPLSIYQFIAQPIWGTFSDWRGVRIFGNLFHPNGYTLFLLPVIILLYSSIRLKFNKLNLVFIIMLIIANILTFSRIGILSMLISFLLFELLFKQGKLFLQKSIIAVFLLLLSLLLIYPIIESSNISHELKVESIEDRIIIWETITPLMIDNLLFGNGLGSYHLFLNDIWHSLGPHSFYLGTVFELGIVGLFIMLLFVFIMITDFYQLKGNLLFQTVKTFGLSLIFAVMIYSITESNAFNQVFSLNLWIILGSSLILVKNKKDININNNCRFKNENN